MIEISQLTMMEDHEQVEICFDKETGELNMSPVMKTWSLQTQDAETGELEQNVSSPVLDHGKIFQVPRSALRDNRRSKWCSKPVERPHVTVVSAKHKAESTTEEKETMCKRMYDICLPILILLLFLPGWVASVCVLMEWVLHRIAHKTDKIGCFRLYNPLCYLTSGRCAICQSQRSAEKVIQMQDKRKLRVINKKLEYLNYVNTMIS